MFSRDELIAICERATVPEARWSDRDSSAAQKQLGHLRALLKCHCGFLVHLESAAPVSTDREQACITDDQTIWLSVFYLGPEAFQGEGVDEEVFYLPTRKCLAESEGGDWC